MEKQAGQNNDAVKTLFAPIYKVVEREDGTVVVSGVLAAEEVDQIGEIFDYATSKPYFESWNARFAEKTDGQSVGNLRAMHQMVAAGKFTAMAYEDESKLISCDAEVVDLNEAAKCLKGVYTGFSIGAKYVKRWKDGKYTRWTADPFEGSLADNPAMPSATFLRKTVDGREMACKFQAPATAKPATAQKGMYTVREFARICEDASYLQKSIEAEELYEQDGSQIGTKMKEIVGQLCALLVEYTEEEAQEITSVIGRTPAPATAVQSKTAEGKTMEGQQMDKDKTTPAVVPAESPEIAEKLAGKLKQAARKAARAHKNLLAAHSEGQKNCKALAKHIESDEGKAAHKGVAEAFESMGDHIEAMGSALANFNGDSEDTDEGAEKVYRRTQKVMEEIREELDGRIGGVEKAVLAMAEALGNFLGQPRPSGVALNATAATVTKTQDAKPETAEKTALELAKSGDIAGAIRLCQQTPKRTFAFGPVVN
jgi:hypothetical protein